MGLLDKAVAKTMNKLRQSGEYEYDYSLTGNVNDEIRNRFTREMLVNATWYKGNDLELKNLYERILPSFKIGKLTSDELNYFWAQPTDGLNIRKVHSGLPQLISEKMVDVILANGYEYNIYKENDEEDEDSKERLDKILRRNMFDILLSESIETSSWGGGSAWKWSSSNKKLVLEVIQPEEYEPTIKHGRIVEDVFITYYYKDNVTYKLKEYYGVDDTGSYIKYKLFKKYEKTEEWFECSIGELEDTKNLKDITFRGVSEKFSIYIPNKLPNSSFKNSKLGESDYSGSHGLFDALDETLSTMVQEFRDGKIRNFWPSNLLPTDPTTQKQYIPPALKKDFITYQGGIGEKEKPTALEQVQGQIHSEKYIETFKKLLEMIVNNAGLSPQTLGVTGIDSTAASEESQELREKTTIRTREKKIAILEPSLERLFEAGLMFDDIINGRIAGNYRVDMNFADYKIETLSDKTTIASQGILSKAWSIRSAVDYVHDEMTEEERILMVVNIKLENDINVFTKEEELVYRKYVQAIEQQKVEV